MNDASDANEACIRGFTASSGYGFLSNYHPSTFIFEGKAYSTVEHAYQSHKTLNEDSRDLIRRAKSPADAKKLGRCLEIRPDWDEVRVPLMREFVRRKFENPLLRHGLIATGNAELIHENTWNDRFWGVCRGIGQNWLGIILMETRQELVKIAREESEIFGDR